ncbi:MAG: hypothetical protein NWE79_05810, partial [Candidatus Bathyarchaeota archaeon]|nr:hypothetical protein [Candidatus Bathyarchaeota archaeon]
YVHIVKTFDGFWEINKDGYLRASRRIQQTRDGGFIEIGQDDDYDELRLVKYAPKTFGGSQDDVGYFVQQTSEGGYIIVGGTESFGEGMEDVYMIKTDSDGNKLWEKTFGGSEHDCGYSIQQTSEGGYIITGYTNSFSEGNSDVYLVKTDALGNIQWEQALTLDTWEPYWGESVLQTSDGGYIILANWDDLMSTFHYEMYLLKTDSNGNLVWWNFLAHGWGFSFQQTTDGGYIVTGFNTTHSPGNPYHVYLIKTDFEGTKLWEKIFGGGVGSGDDTSKGYSVQQTIDGGYIIAGSKIGQLHLLKTDSSGNKLWEKTFGGSNSDSGYSIQKTTDGGYIIVGKTESFGAGMEDVYLIKFFETPLAFFEDGFESGDLG